MPKTTNPETVYESGATTDPDDANNAWATDPDLSRDLVAIHALRCLPASVKRSLQERSPIV